MKSLLRLAHMAGVLLILSPCVSSGQGSDRAKPQPISVARTLSGAKRLEALSRALKQKDASSPYAALSAFANQESSGVLGARAALALGYFDYSKGRYAAAAKWLVRAKQDPLLREYALYWSAETDLALHQEPTALAELKQIREDFPDSAINDQILQSLGDAALASNQPAEAVAALNASQLTQQRSGLLFLRAQAHERANQPLEAAADYEAIYIHFPLTEQAEEAAMKLDFLGSSSNGQIPPIALGERVTHASILYGAKKWSDARREYTQILAQLTGVDRDRAELRILECGMALGGGPSEVIGLQINDMDVNAERFYSLAEYYRSNQEEVQMVEAVEAAASRSPSSQWAETSLFLAGNFYWVKLDRDRAAGFYQRLEEQFATSPDAVPAQWRVTWTAVLKRAPEAAELLQQHLRRFPGSSYTPDALYWLGRLAEDAGVPGLARSYYDKLIERYPQNYFENLALARTRGLDPGPKQAADVLALIPPLPAAQKLGDTIPAPAAKRQARAEALRSIAFDASAEIELRAAYAATGEPRLLLEAAQAAADSGHYGVAVSLIRQIYPQLESHSLLDLPRPVWITAYALPFQASIRRWSAASGIDPMFVAGLIHQESAFEPEARSSKNAIGLMQLLPQTARRLAVAAKLRYSQSRLSDPDYNVRLGTIYVADLQKQFGNLESVLAAYNAGEDRVTLWTSGQTYREPAEFVDSIPFTETRQYVEIVSRNADIYRRLYGVENDVRKTRARGGN